MHIKKSVIQVNFMPSKFFYYGSLDTCRSFDTCCQGYVIKQHKNPILFLQVKIFYRLCFYFIQDALWYIETVLQAWWSWITNFIVWLVLQNNVPFVKIEQNMYHYKTLLIGVERNFRDNDPWLLFILEIVRVSIYAFEGKFGHPS